METKVITPGKIVPSKCCLPSWNISYIILFLNYVITYFQPLYATFMNVDKNVNEHQTKLFCGKMGGVYVTYVADTDM